MIVVIFIYFLKEFLFIFSFILVYQVKLNENKCYLGKHLK